jgi:hypothetical protein
LSFWRIDGAPSRKTGEKLDAESCLHNFIYLKRWPPKPIWNLCAALFGRVLRRVWRNR